MEPPPPMRPSDNPISAARAYPSASIESKSASLPPRSQNDSRNHERDEIVSRVDQPQRLRLEREERRPIARRAGETEPADCADDRTVRRVRLGDVKQNHRKRGRRGQPTQEDLDVHHRSRTTAAL